MLRLVERVANPYRVRSAVGGVLIAVAAFAVGSAPDPASAQSFDCRNARSPDELLICADPRLARLDEQLTTMYRLQSGRLGREERETFEQHGTFFLNARRRCGDSIRCIEQSYRNRIKELEDLIAQSDRGGGQTAEVTEAMSERHSRRESGGAAKRQALSPAAIEATKILDPAKGVEAPAASEPAPVAAPPKRQVKRETTTTATVQPQPSTPAKAGQPSVAASGSSTPPAVSWVNPPPAR